VTDSKIDAAIAYVTKAVKRLEKADRNSHGNYAFASIDDFLAMTGRLCGEAGLSVLMDEADFEIIPDMFATKQGKVSALRMKFAITLRCEGEMAGPYHRSILVPANMGSQAFGAAQSYVLKQFLRATFQIPTGDKGEDINAHDTGEMRGTEIISDAQYAELTALVSATGTDLQKLCEFYRCDALIRLPAASFDHARTVLRSKLPAQPDQEAA